MFKQFYEEYYSDDDYSEDDYSEDNSSIIDLYEEIFNEKLYDKELYDKELYDKQLYDKELFDEQLFDDDKEIYNDCFKNDKNVEDILNHYIITNDLKYLANHLFSSINPDLLLKGYFNQYTTKQIKTTNFFKKIIKRIKNNKKN